MKRFLGLLIVVLLLFVGCTTDQGAVDPVMMDEPNVAMDIEEEEVPLADGMVGEEGVEKDMGGMMMLTLEELAAYNGENGMPAYVAVEGKIYDVTNHPQWSTGMHGGNMAGTDITDMLKAAPHGMSKLEEIDEVGVLTDDMMDKDMMMKLTLDELAAYNGKDGMPAYVAVDGMIYDVTDHPQWSTGMHGGNMAGTDITEMLKSAPHGMGKLDEVMKVGELVQ